MKRRFFSVAVILALAGSVMFTSCIGPFNLSKELLAWNRTIDSKFVNALVFFVFTPVYVVTLVGDSLIFNTIEFWSGSNPIEAGIIKQVQGENGVYTVETLENGYNITDENGNLVSFVYDKKSNTWSSVEAGKTTKLVKIGEDGNAIVYLPNGDEQKVELSVQGILAFRQTYNASHYLASK